MRSFCWALAWAALPATALAQDAGMAVPPAGCGAVTPAGECVGSVVRYCDDTVTPNAIVEYDCVADLDPAAICQTINPEYGVDCAMPTGGECIFADGDGVLFQSFCQGIGNACVETATTSVCITGSPACTDDEVGGCRGDQAVIECFEAQPWLVDCVSFGATCAAGVCVGVPEGGSCGDGIECAAPFVCDSDNTCSPVASVDAGSAADAASPRPDASVTTTPDAGIRRADSGVKAPVATTTEESSCSSVAGGDGSGAASLLLVAAGLVVALNLRRRR